MSSHAAFAAALAAALLLPAAASHAACVSCPGDPLNDFEAGRYIFVSEADDATAVFINPAGLAQSRKPNLFWDLSASRDIDHVSFAAQLGGLGLGYRHRDLDTGEPGGKNLDTYTVGLGFGPRVFRLGIQGAWTTTDLPGDNAGSLWAGFQSRLHRRFSVGVAVRNANQPHFLTSRARPQYQAALSLRPFPVAEEFTLSGQVTLADGDGPTDVSVSAAYENPGGWGVRALAEFPEIGDARFGLAATLFFPQSRSNFAVRNTADDRARTWTAALYHGDTRQEAITLAKSVAVLRMGGEYDDEASGFVLLGGGAQGALDLIRRIDDAAQDKSVRALALRIGHLSGGFLSPVTAQHEELRAAILRFRQSGKPVVAYLSNVNNQAASVYVASAADQVILPPMAGIQGLGVSFHMTRWKRTFEKFGIAWDADTSGTYKSTFHAHYTDTTSAEQRAAIETLLGDAYFRLMNGLMNARGVTESDMLSLGTGRVVFPRECVSTGLVDSLGWWDDALKAADRLAGGDGESVPKTQKLPDRDPWATRWAPPAAVAVIPVSGSISSGSSSQDWLRGGRTMGSETVVRQLKAAASHPRVKAVVFRVDTGGGSALASEEIRQEIKRLKKRGMPFYVSMGSAAASGGYWISMDADTIFANPSTVTGSIGVVASFPIFEGLYETLDMTSETWKRGEHTDMFDMNRPMTPEEREMLNASLNFIYDEFLDGVSQGRNLPLDTVRGLAGGRVYFGGQARDLGLVDRIGTLHDAVVAAAWRAGIQDDFEVLTVRYKDRGLLGRAMNVVGLGRGGYEPPVDMDPVRAEAWRLLPWSASAP